MISKQKVMELLSTVKDPELQIGIVDLGLIYEVTVGARETHPTVKILMTLTTPGCPLAGTIQRMVRDALYPIKELDVDKDVEVEITFDPPWVPELMSAEAKAELGMD